MDLNKLSLFSMMKKRLSWLSQRQEVLAQNIANADTPDYKPVDLKPFKFGDLVRRESMQVNMDVTSEGHLGGQRKRIRDFDSEQAQKPFETAPAGNAVILEEQMAKVNENQINHRLTTEIYKRNLSMIKMALGKN